MGEVPLASATGLEGRLGSNTEASNHTFALPLVSSRDRETFTSTGTSSPWKLSQLYRKLWCAIGVDREAPSLATASRTLSLVPSLMTGEYLGTGLCALSNSGKVG